MKKWNGIRVWDKDPGARDVYVDFKDEFNVSNHDQKIVLKLSCDSIFAVSVNGETAGFGNCSNMPDHALFYTFDITHLCRKTNILEVTVWHLGVDSQTYITQDAFLSYAVSQGKRLLTKSGPQTKCRRNGTYVGGLGRMITPQLGLGYSCDLEGKPGPYRPVSVLGPGTAFPTGISNLKLLDRPSIRMIETEQSLIADMGGETVGFLTFDIKAPAPCDITISYGEHLVYGHVPGKIHGRDFTASFHLRKGKNHFLNLFRRFAGRYIEIDRKDVTVEYLGLLPCVYPQRRQRRFFENPVDQKIYDVSVKTLQCCMHEHYEDCPWREQALYTMDSRNQMLCGYYAFRGHAFQKANLRLIGRGLREDGLLSICFPSGRDIPIPFFSLVYILQVYEYLKYTDDREDESFYKGVMSAIMHMFGSHMKDGLIRSFPYPCWNFYEWNEPSSHHSDLSRKKEDPGEDYADLILNCMYVYVSGLYDRMTGAHTDVESTKQAIRKAFYDPEKGLFKLCTVGEDFSQLGQSMACLAGLGDEGLKERIMSDTTLIPATLSMRTFVYDAVMTGKQEETDWVLQDIRNRFGKMISSGADTFWETEKGPDDFGGAGSMCHGWSAIPVFYLAKIFEKNEKKY